MLPRHHVIIDTGTGGISALFLGRLHMTVDQAIEECVQMARTVYKSEVGPSWLARFRRSGARAAFDGKALTDCLRDAVAQYLRDPDPDALLFETSNPQCCVAVLAATSACADSPRAFRTDLATPSYGIIDVALATCDGCLVPCCVRPYLGTLLHLPPVHLILRTAAARLGI